MLTNLLFTDVLSGDFETAFRRDKTLFYLAERAFQENKTAFCYWLIFKLFCLNAKLLCRRLGFELSEWIWGFFDWLFANRIEYHVRPM